MIANNKDERDIFLIPPNFLNEGSLFGGMLKLRNTLEAVILIVGVTIPILKITALSFTGKIIALCLTALPIGIFALIGIGGESLTAFLLNFFRFLRSRRSYYKSDAALQQPESRLEITQSENEYPEEFGEAEKKKKGKRRASKAWTDPFPVEKIENGICYLKDKRYIKIIDDASLFPRRTQKEVDRFYLYNLDVSFILQITDTIFNLLYREWICPSL